MKAPRVDASPLPFVVAALGVFLLTMMDLTIKAVTATFSTSEIVLLRYLIASVLAGGLFLALRMPWPDRVSVRANALRAVAMLSTAWLFFYALAHVPLAEAFALAFTAPVFMALLGRAILGEPVTARVWVAIALGLTGALIVLWGGVAGPGARGDLTGYLAAMGSAVTYALVMVLLRKQSAREGFVSFIAQQNLYATPVAALLLFVLWDRGDPAPFAALDAQSAALFAVIGTLGICGQLALGYAFSRAEAARLGVLDYTGFIWGAGLAWLWFGEVPTSATLVGVSLIVIGAITAIRR
jgi:drug/metabolite transporter (DMT)-like permease